MALRRSTRLARIAGLTANAQRVAAEALAKATHDLATIEQQRRDLQQYRQEYLGRLVSGATLAGYDAQKLRVFLARIDQAIERVSQHARTAQRRVEREREQLMAQTRRMGALEKITAQAKTLESRRAEAQLQRRIDDARRPSSER